MKKYMNNTRTQCIFEKEDDSKGETGYILVVTNIPEIEITPDEIYSWSGGYINYCFKEYYCNKIVAEVIRHGNHFIENICASNYLQSVWIGDEFKGHDIMYTRARVRPCLMKNKIKLDR